MDLLPKVVADFKSEPYWNSFFTKQGSKNFEWYGEYAQISGHIHKYVRETDDILIPGCGNSSLSENLYDKNYRRITSIDISPVAIKQMLARNATARPEMKFLEMNVADMKFDKESFKVVLDKGTLDALMPDGELETKEFVRKYFREIDRVIKPLGRFLCISLLQDHILDELLEWFPKHNWMWRVVKCHETETEGESTLPVFMVVCTKMLRPTDPIFEVDISGDPKRCSSAEEAKNEVRSLQYTALVLSGVKNNILDEEISFKLTSSKNSSATRYTVYIIDRKPKKAKTLSSYGCFIVPQGRECEWLFVNDKGRKKLTTVGDLGRLDRVAIVTLHRGEFYDGLEQIQSELNSVMLDYKPKDCFSTINYLSLESDQFIGEREQRYEGSSKCSGKYVVDDVKLKSDGTTYRRLIFLNSQNVVQSEARLMMMRTKKGTREVADLIHLTCDHHVYMSIATHAGCKNKAEPSVAVIGLGGGGLCSFLKAFLPQAKIVGVDFDEEMQKVAVDWFGLKLDKNLKVVIDDGLKFLEDASKNKDKFDAVLFDVDSKDSTLGMSCPPKQFLEDKALANVSKVLTETGLFIVNVVIRDETLRPGIVEKLKSKFKTVLGYKLEEDLNEIFVCAKSKTEPENLKNSLSESASAINKFFKNKRKHDCIIRIEDYIKNLTL